MPDHKRDRQVAEDRDRRNRQEQADGLVNGWFWDWVDYHTQVNPRSDWESKEDGFAFWNNWRGQFVVKGLHAAPDAVECSNRVALLLLKNKGDHLHHLVEEFHKLLADRRDRFESEFSGNLEAARAAAAGCLDCGGSIGLTTRYIHDRGRDRHARYAHPTAHHVVFYCACHYGRAVKANHERDDATESYRKRIPDLADHPDLIRDLKPWSDRPDNRYCYRRESWDEANNRPVRLDLAGLKRLTAPTRAACDAVREPRKSRGVHTANQARFLEGLHGTLRDWWPRCPGDVRAAVLGEFADDDRPFDLGVADRATQILWRVRAEQVAAAEAEAKAAPAEATTADAGGPAA